MKDEKFACPNVDCDYTHYDKGECPYCGLSLDRIKGEETIPADDMEGPMTEMPVATFDDDPDLWYVNDPETLETI